MTKESMISIHKITTVDELDRLSDDWQRLYSGCPDAGIFNSWDWNRLWWKHYGGKNELSVLVATINGKVEGIAPLYLGLSSAVKVIRVPTLRFIGSGGDTSPDDLGPLCSPTNERAICIEFAHYVYERLNTKRLLLQDMCSESPFLQALLDLGAQYKWADAVLTKNRRRVDILPASVDEFSANLSRNARKQRKRRLQKLLCNGNVQFTYCETPDQVDGTFTKLVQLHRTRQNSKGEDGSFSSDSYKNFHQALMHKALERNELRLMTLNLDNQIIGIEYAFQVNGQLAFFQTGFDPEFSHLSPGHIMMMHMIGRAISEGAYKIDCLKGDYDYKATYAKKWKQSVSLDMFRSKLIASLSGVVRTLRSLPNSGNASHLESVTLKQLNHRHTSRHLTKAENNGLIAQERATSRH